jgi:hypothetical protein
MLIAVLSHADIASDHIMTAKHRINQTVVDFGEAIRSVHAFSIGAVFAGMCL